MAPDVEATALRLLGNARRLGSPAWALAFALQSLAPIEGRTWRPLCCWCVERTDPHAPAYRLALLPSQSGGDCWSCPVSGCDVLVAAVPVEA